jgi:hypothetical protein
LGHFWRTASISRLIDILSPTATPPPSIGMLMSMPKSRRLICAVAESQPAARCSLDGVFVSAVRRCSPAECQAARQPHIPVRCLVELGERGSDQERAAHEQPIRGGTPADPADRPPWMNRSLSRSCVLDSMTSA